MKWSYVMLCTAVLLAGCGPSLSRFSERTGSMNLPIRWQRLVGEEGGTCDRCGGTQRELRHAYESLKASLRPLGINVVLVEQALTAQECAEDISRSNRIWIGDRLLEEWLGAQVGRSHCASCCSELGEDVECRTVTVDGNTYEVVPAELIVKAGLLAASEVLAAQSPGPCCPSSSKTQGAHDDCCPGSKKADREP